MARSGSDRRVADSAARERGAWSVELCSARVPDPAVRLTAVLRVTRQRSGTGRSGVAEDGGSGDHCPNQLLKDQLFTGTERAFGREKWRFCAFLATTPAAAEPG